MSHIIITIPLASDDGMPSHKPALLWQLYHMIYII